MTAIELEKVEDQQAEMLLVVHSSALKLWHGLQHADDETDDGKAPNATADGLVEAPHEEKVLHKSDENGHGRVLKLPLQEGINGLDASQVLERHVDLEAGELVHIFDQGNARMGNDGGQTDDSEPLGDKKLLELVQPVFGSEVGRRAALDEARRADDEVHVRGWEIETGHERSERIDMSRGKVTPIALHGLSELLYEVGPDALLKLSGTDKVVKA